MLGTRVYLIDDFQKHLDTAQKITQFLVPFFWGGGVDDRQAWSQSQHLHQISPSFREIVWPFLPWVLKVSVTVRHKRLSRWPSRKQSWSLLSGESLTYLRGKLLKEKHSEEDKVAPSVGVGFSEESRTSWLTYLWFLWFLKLHLKALQRNFKGYAIGCFWGALEDHTADKVKDAIGCFWGALEDHTADKVKIPRSCGLQKKLRCYYC